MRRSRGHGHPVADTMSPVTDEVELLLAWREGDEGAGDELVRRHFATVFRFFATKVSRGAEDLTQRTFVSLVESYRRGAQVTNLRAYLLGIARNELAAYIRQRQRQVDEPGSVSMLELEGSPSQLVAHREEQRVLLQALRMIPVEQQMTLELFYWEDLGVGEIAQVLGIEPGTVKSRLHRARSRLREALDRLIRSGRLNRATQTSLEEWVRTMRQMIDPPPSPAAGET